MAKERLTCHLCGFKIDTQKEADHCQRCGANLRNIEEEELKRDGLVFYRKKLTAQQQSALYLTNKRLFLVMARKGVLGFGGDGGLVGAMNLSNGGGKKVLEFNIPLENIEKVSLEETKLSKYIVVETIDGMEYKMFASKFRDKLVHEEWVEAIAQEAGL